MKKSVFLSFIHKYNLNGLCESVKYVVKNNKLITSFNSDDRSLIGQLRLNTFEYEDIEFGIFDTTKLIKMLSAASDDIELKFHQIQQSAYNMNIVDEKDKSFKLTFVCSDPQIIPKSGMMKNTPEWDVEIPLTSEFIDKFIKSQSALEANIIAFSSENNQVKLSMGYSVNNTHRITYSIDATINNECPTILFNSEYIKTILANNKDLVTGSIKISSKQIMQITTENELYKAVYYLVASQNV